MRGIHMLVAALAGVFLALPAGAAPNLANKTWIDRECMMAFEFGPDSRFLEFGMDYDGRTGRWWHEAGMLYLQYDGGGNVQTPISDEMFELTYPYASGSYTCRFTPKD